MKFKLDENLGELGREILEADGHDVMSVAQQSLSGADDNRLYAICRDEARVLVTLDHDFGHVLRFPPEATAGIVVLECGKPASPLKIRARMEEFVRVLRAEQLDGHLWIVEPGRVRVHQKRSTD
jgi:predicted nuclease of predicted toxin-antitoxin system